MKLQASEIYTGIKMWNNFLLGLESKTEIGLIQCVPFIARQGAGILIKTLSNDGKDEGKISISDSAARALFAMLPHCLRELADYEHAHGYYTPPTTPLL